MLKHLILFNLIALGFAQNFPSGYFPIPNQPLISPPPVNFFPVPYYAPHSYYPIITDFTEDILRNENEISLPEMTILAEKSVQVFLKNYENFLNQRKTLGRTKDNPSWETISILISDSIAQLRSDYHKAIIGVKKS